MNLVGFPPAIAQRFCSIPATSKNGVNLSTDEYFRLEIIPFDKTLKNHFYP
jgi:hypothetical protein